MTERADGRLGTVPYRCELCAGKPRWQLERYGDVIVTWACADHLVLILIDFLPTDKHRDRATIIDLENTVKVVAR